MAAADFDNVKSQVGVCGLWCGSCIVGNGVLRQLTRRYRALTAAYGLEEWAPDDLDYPEFERGLMSIQAAASCPGCRKGGGRDTCEIRACASARDRLECSECGTGGSCAHRDVLEHMRSGAAAAGMIVRTEALSGDDPIEGWIERISSAWPCSILFDGPGGGPHADQV